jgi:hypothetical protein
MPGIWARVFEAVAKDVKRSLNLAKSQKKITAARFERSIVPNRCAADGTAPGVSPTGDGDIENRVDMLPGHQRSGNKT